MPDLRQRWKKGSEILVASKWLRVTAISTAAALTMISLGGCSTASKDISPLYVSPMQYSPYDCSQLVMESQRIQARVNELGGRLDTAARNDAQIAGIGIILFWPALFALGGTKQQEAEYARLRGEYDAVQQTAVQKKCGAEPAATPAVAPPVTPAPAPAPVPAAAPQAAPAASAAV